MRPKQLLFIAALVCLIAFSASADVTRIAPSTVRFADLEAFVTLYGTGLYGNESMFGTITGPAGAFVLEPNAASDAEVTFYVPEHAAFVPGRYTVVLQSKNAGEPVRTMSPIEFSVVDEVIVGGVPLLALPEGIFAEATTANGAVVEFDVSALNYDNTQIAVTCSRRSGEAFGMGASEVACSASNEYGTSQDRFWVVVTDTTRPVLTVPANIVTEDAVVSYVATALDNIDGELVPTCHPASGSVFQAGLTTVQCFATDNHLNYAFGSFTVLRPEQPPVVTVPANITVEAPTTYGVDVYFDASSTNNGAVVCSPESGATFPIGTTMVTCTASNSAGSDTKTFTVTVFTNADSVPPVITVPADMTVEATTADGAIVTYTVTAVDDLDGPVPVLCNPESDGQFPMGTTTVQCSALDVSGNLATRSFTVTVRDSTAPVIVVATATPDSLWPPNHQMVDVTLNVVALDVIDASPVVQIASVASNQPVNGTGDGDTSPDWVVTGPRTLQLRAERAGNSERVYTIYVTATDDSGNTSTRSVTVKVAQSKKRAVR